MYHSWSGSVPRLWDDLRFPAAGLRIPGASGPANTNFGTLSFAGNADNTATGVAQMPHGWKLESTVEAHLHLNAPTSAAANTRWQFSYSVGKRDGAFSAGDIGTYTDLTEVTVANPQDTDKHIYADLGDIPMTGIDTVSSIVLWKITRLADSDELDTDANAWNLVELDFHYQLDTKGSRQETAK